MKRPSPDHTVCLGSHIVLEAISFRAKIGPVLPVKVQV